MPQSQRIEQPNAYKDHAMGACSAGSLVQALARHATERPDDPAICFFTHDAGTSTQLTYADLHRRVRAFAAHLIRTVAPNQAVLVLMQSDADSVVALFACLYGGVIGIPMPVPGRNGSTVRLNAIAASSGAVAIVGPIELRGLVPLHPALPWLSIADADAEAEGLSASPAGSATALLQYTSGSTRAPRGVVLTHDNLVANLEMLRTAFTVDADSRFASWLPLFHDMGLAMLLMPLYFGRPGILMPPLAFIRRPARWLTMTGLFGATITGAPNFAYEMCVRRVTPQEIDDLDLSRCRLAFCGAEPVRMDTMLRFERTFRPAGFRASALYPCYGMAEAVCFVSGGFLPTDAGGSLANGGKPNLLVSCGAPASGSLVVIVDPDHLTPCADGCVGEVWISGPHVGAGYADGEDEDHVRFKAKLAAWPNRTFLRTGDLGLLSDGQLTIAGRLRDVIIHRGANLHATDIETTVAGCHAAFGEVGAAFAWTVEGSEEVVVVQEMARRPDPVDRQVALAAVIDAVAAHHGVRLFDLVLVRAGTIPRTTSGKVRRDACRTLYQDGALQPWSGKPRSPVSSVPNPHRDKAVGYGPRSW